MTLEEHELMYLGQPEQQQQQQQQQQHLSSMMLQPQLYHQQNINIASHRGNVIVAAPSPVSDSGSIENEQQQQQQRQSQSQQKRKMYGQVCSVATPQQASVARRNARERNRVKQVNNGFATLRDHIPPALAQAFCSPGTPQAGGSRAANKKLSKVETLRMAVEYIRNLKQLIEQHDADSSSSSSAGSPLPQNNQSMCSSSSVASELDHHQQQVEFRDQSPDIMSSYEHQQDLQHSLQDCQQQFSQSPMYVPTPSSEASCSPTPSFMSDASSVGGGQIYGATFDSQIYSYGVNDELSPTQAVVDLISLWQNQQQVPQQMSH